MTLRTPKTSRVAFPSSLRSGRERFLLVLTTTSPQCLGAVLPEVGRLVSLSVVDTVRAAFSRDGVGEFPAEIGPGRVAWGWRCG